MKSCAFAENRFAPCAYETPAAPFTVEKLPPPTSTPPVPSCWNVFLRGDFDNAAQLPTVFGWKTRCQHAQGLDFRASKEGATPASDLRQRRPSTTNCTSYSEPRG